MSVRSITCLAAFLVCTASAADSLSTRLLGARDEATVEAILSSVAPAEITPALFDDCEKSARASLDHYENAASVREFRAALAVARRLDGSHQMAAAWLGMGIAQSRMR